MSDRYKIQTYVSDRYFVSTILRSSSCAERPDPYFETMVFPWDPRTRERGTDYWIVEGNANTPDDALRQHFQECAKLYDQPEGEKNEETLRREAHSP